MLEVWKDIEGFEGIYQISNIGRVKSLQRIRYNTLSENIKERILKPVLNTEGYHQVALYKDGKNQHPKVHRLVAIAFLSNISLKQYINHIDGNKENNCVNNIEWCTAAENNFHTHRVLNKCCGSTHHFSKLSELDVNKIKLLFVEGNTIASIAKLFNVSQTSISNIKNKKAYRCYQ